MKPIQQKVFDISVNITCIGALTKIISYRMIDGNIRGVLENMGNVCMITGTIGALSQCDDNIKDILKKLDDIIYREV